MHSHPEVDPHGRNKVARKKEAVSELHQDAGFADTGVSQQHDLGR
jgi:hypothetical protein